MSITAPKVILRIGSHAEKDYFQKLAGQLNGVMFGGNLLEIAPAATASFLVSMWQQRGSKGPVPFYLDPITYCFGTYIDPQTKRRNSDLTTLMSTRKDRKTKKEFTAVKDAYSELASELGPSFRTAVNDGVHCKAIDLISILPSDRDALCRGVIDYQLRRIDQVIASEIPSDDEVMKAAFKDIGKPAAVFAPYFVIENEWAEAGLKVSLDLAARSSALNIPIPVHAVICASEKILDNPDHIALLVAELPKSKVEGVWFWFDGFDEREAPLNRLIAYRQLVRGLKGKMNVFALHGGLLSLLLAHDGMTGISHGVGYGEKKDIVNVIGAAAPTVRYYLPPISKRIGVPEVERCFKDVGVVDASSFFSIVCKCQICKGVVGDDLDNFSKFGDVHWANAESKRESQTPAAAKICRFHFLLNRLKEPSIVAKLAPNRRAHFVKEMAANWRNIASLQPHVGQRDRDGFLEFWERTLTD